MKPSFNHTVDILVKAYFNDTLKHRTCAACAVTNIIGGSEWKYFFCTFTDSCDTLTQKQYFNPPWYNDEHTGLSLRRLRARGAELIKKSGYSKIELARIENAFETAPGSINRDEWMFNGLMAVVNVLADIHGISLEETQKAKELFVKAV